MCRSIAALGYGLFVRTASLLAAADAHNKVESTRRFIELVKLRRKRGTLEAEGGGGWAVTKLPSEVWEMVLQEAVDVEVDEAMHRLLRRYLFRQCRGNELNRLRQLEARGQPLTWLVAYEDAQKNGCDECLFETASRWTDATDNIENAVSHKRSLQASSCLLTTSHLQLVQNLLAFFSLSLSTGIPTPCPFYNYDDFLCSSFIALPTSHDSIAQALGGAYGPPEGDADHVLDVSFQLPADADARFKRFVRTYKLEVVAVEDRGAEQVKEGGGHKEKAKERGGQASWRLYCTVETVW